MAEVKEDARGKGSESGTSNWRCVRLHATLPPTWPPPPASPPSPSPAFLISPTASLLHNYSNHHLLFLPPDFTMGTLCTLLLLFSLSLLLLPASVSATAGPDTAPPSGAAGAVGSPAWAAPAAIIATLRSLSLALQCLFTRLASARLARGDLAGAERARNIANTMGNSFQWWTGLGTLSWDYVTNYFFSQSASRGVGVAEAMGYLSDLSALVGEVTRLGSDSERLQWLARNYSRAFAVAKSALGNLLSVFDSDGAIRSCVLAIQREVLEGDLLRDILRLDPTDLEGVVRMGRDVLQRIFGPAPQGQREGEL